MTRQIQEQLGAAGLNPREVSVPERIDGSLLQTPAVPHTVRSRPRAQFECKGVTVRTYRCYHPDYNLQFDVAETLSEHGEDTLTLLFTAEDIEDLVLKALTTAKLDAAYAAS